MRDSCAFQRCAVMGNYHLLGAEKFLEVLDKIKEKSYLLF
jgi:hypothetical protein